MRNSIQEIRFQRELNKIEKSIYDNILHICEENLICFLQIESSLFGGEKIAYAYFDDGTNEGLFVPLLVNRKAICLNMRTQDVIKKDSDLYYYLLNHCCDVFPCFVRMNF